MATTLQSTTRIKTYSSVVSMARNIHPTINGGLEPESALNTDKHRLLPDQNRAFKALLRRSPVPTPLSPHQCIDLFSRGATLEARRGWVFGAWLRLVVDLKTQFLRLLLDR